MHRGKTAYSQVVYTVEFDWDSNTKIWSAISCSQWCLALKECQYNCACMFFLYSGIVYLYFLLICTACIIIVQLILYCECYITKAFCMRGSSPSCIADQYSFSADLALYLCSMICIHQGHKAMPACILYLMLVKHYTHAYNQCCANKWAVHFSADTMCGVRCIQTTAMTDNMHILQLMMLMSQCVILSVVISLLYNKADCWGR